MEKVLKVYIIVILSKLVFWCECELPVKVARIFFYVVKGNIFTK